MKRRIFALLLGLTMTVTSVAVPAKAAEVADATEATDVVIADAFPDEYFAGYVSDNFDSDADGKLNQDEIAAAKIVDLSWEWYLTDTTGIEYLTEATEINLNYLEVESVDLSKNTKLEVLDIGQTYIENIDLSNNPELKVLKAQRSALTSLDVTNNTKLETLNLENTRIESLDVSKNTALKELVLDMTNVSKVDVSKNTKLEKLTLIGCSEVKELSLSKNTALKTLDISGTGILSVSLSRNTALETLKSYAIAKVYKHNFDTGFGSYVAVEPAPLKSLSLSKNKALKLLYLDGSDISDMKDVDLTAFPSLTKVSFINTGLKSIKFNDSVAYEAIYVDQNALKAADRPALAEKAKVEWGIQNVTAKVPSTDTLETFDLNSIVDITRVTVAASDDVEYNAETGIVTFKGENKAFAYKYALDPSGSYKMDVNVTVVHKTTVEEIIEMIDAIGTVTLESEEAIEAAREAYDALTEEEKQLVENYSVLEEAEATLAALKKEVADKEAAQTVIEMIDAIGTVTLESEETITATREAYDALTEDQKQYVENYSILEEAEATLAALKEETEKIEDDDTDESNTDDGNTDNDNTEDETSGADDNENEDNSSSTVKTGDTNMILPYLFAMAAALFVIVRKKFNR